MNKNISLNKVTLIRTAVQKAPLGPRPITNRPRRNRKLPPEDAGRCTSVSALTPCGQALALARASANRRGRHRRRRRRRGRAGSRGSSDRCWK